MNKKYIKLSQWAKPYGNTATASPSAKQKISLGKYIKKNNYGWYSN